MLLLLPGLICDQTVWQQQIDALSDVAVCTCADYGSLDSIPAMAEAVLRTAPERFSIAGHSMGGRVALEIYRRAPDRVARIALLNTGYLPLAAGAAGEEEARKRGELVALAQSQGMRAMLRQWLPPMIDSRRINDTVLVNAIIEMMSRKDSGDFRRAGAGVAGPSGCQPGAGTNPMSRVAAHRPRGRMERSRAARGDGCQDRRQPAGDRSRLRPHVDAGTSGRSQPPRCGRGWLYLLRLWNPAARI